MRYAIVFLLFLSASIGNSQPSPSQKKLLLTGESNTVGSGFYTGNGKNRIYWLLDDEFTVPLSAGSVNGTYATDGVNLRKDGRVTL